MNTQVENQVQTQSARIMERLERYGYYFTLDETDDTIWVNGDRISDPIRAVIRTNMRNAEFRSMGAVEDAYTSAAYLNRRHPIKEYLEDLVWNKQPNIATLAAFIQDKDGIFYDWFRRWMIGSVARVYTGSQNPVLVLDGKQGCGKSTFARFLCPLPDRFFEGSINPDDKDSHIRLMNKWIWEVGELGSTTRRADIDALKFFLTQETVTARKSYGREDTIKPALASFIGTVNPGPGFLNDKSGSRRFLIASVEYIDWSYKTQVNMNQVWAEAVYAYRLGEDWTLDKELQERANEINAQHEVPDPVEDRLLSQFEVDPSIEAWIPTDVIIQKLRDTGLNVGTDRSLSMAIANVMQSMGCRKQKQDYKGGRPNGYWGVRERGLVE